MPRAQHHEENAVDMAIAEAAAEEQNDEYRAAFESAGDEVFTVPPEMAGHSRPGYERDDEQLQIDATVEDFYNKWVAAGSPDPGKVGGWANCIAAGVVGGYWVTRAKEPDKKKKIRNAAQRGGHGVKFGSLGVRLPSMPQDGKLLLSFVVKDVQHRNRGN